MLNHALLEVLAERCERELPNHVLDIEIAKAVGWVFRPGTFCWAIPDSVDTRTSVPYFTRSLDAAMRWLNPNWVLVYMSDIGADGLSLVELGNPGTTPVGKVVGIGTGTHSMASVYCAAALRAIIADEKEKHRG